MARAGALRRSICDHVWEPSFTPRMVDALEPRMLSGGELEHRHRFSVVMDYATRVRTGSAYFAASVLAYLQPQGTLAAAGSSSSAERSH